MAKRAGISVSCHLDSTRFLSMTIVQKKRKLMDNVATWIFILTGDSI